MQAPERATSAGRRRNLGVELRPSRRIQLLSWALLVLFAACMLACVAAWFVLLTTICDSPRKPVPHTQHVTPYSCHGMTVYLSPLQDAMLTWLTPIGLLFMLLGFLAAVMVVLSYAKVRVDVNIDVTDTSGRTPPPAAG